MNDKDPAVFAAHILECIEKVEEYAENATKEDYKNSSQLQDAVIGRIEIIGEEVYSDLLADYLAGDTGRSH